MESLTQAFRQGNLEVAHQASQATSATCNPSSLLLAAVEGNAGGAQDELVKLALEMKANPNSVQATSGHSAFTMACTTGRLESVRLLMDAKASVHHGGGHGHPKGTTPLRDSSITSMVTPVMVCIQQDQPAMLRLLLTRSPSIATLLGVRTGTESHTTVGSDLESKTSANSLEEENEEEEHENTVLQAVLSPVLTLATIKAARADAELIQLERLEAPSSTSTTSSSSSPSTSSLSPRRAKSIHDSCLSVLAEYCSKAIAKGESDSTAVTCDMDPVVLDGLWTDVALVASREGGVAVLHLLRTTGLWTDPDASHPHTGATALHAAAESNQAAVAGWLLDAKADAEVRAKEDGATPLVRCGHPTQHGTDVMALLLARGAKIDAADDEGLTVFHLSAFYSDDVALRHLLQHVMSHPNYSPEERKRLFDLRNARGRTALHVACASGSIIAQKMLIDAGFDTAARDKAGKTPQDIADANLEMMTGILENDPDVVSAALDRGAHPHFSTITGEFPIPLAASIGSDQALAMLLARRWGGCDYADDVDEYGRSALLLATQGGHKTCVKLLITARADPNLRSLPENAEDDEEGGLTQYRHGDGGEEEEGEDTSSEQARRKLAITPLHAATLLPDSDVLNLFISAFGANALDPDIPDGQGRTALLQAVERGDLDVARILVKTLRASVDIPDAQGKTPLQCVLAWQSSLGSDGGSVRSDKAKIMSLLLGEAACSESEDVEEAKWKSDSADVAAAEIYEQITSELEAEAANNNSHSSNSSRARDSEIPSSEVVAEAAGLRER